MSNSGSRLEGLIPEAYAPHAERLLASMSELELHTREVDVAEGVYRAATDTAGQLRFPAGPDAVELARAR